MSKRMTSGIVAAVVAVGMSVPAVGMASGGGTPHKTPPKCHLKKSKGHHSKSKNTKGNKCGKTTV